MEKLLSTRWKIAWFLMLISLVRSMDGVNFSVAAKQIMPEYGLSNVRMGLLYTVYVLGYAAFHLPGGLLADRVGPRKMLAGALSWWSLFTALTALAPQLPGLALLGPFFAFLVVRFLIGMGEGVCYPGSSRTIANWMAEDERAAASGLLWSGLGVGYAITPPVVAFLMVHYGWRVAFYGFAVLGILLSAAWYSYATDVPEDHPAVGDEELRRIRGGKDPAAEPGSRAVPWRVILTTRNVWLLGAVGFCLGYGAFLYQAWFYLYLVNVRGFSQISGGFFTSLPFLAIAVFTPAGGLLSDVLAHRWGKTLGRRLTGIAGLLLSAVSIAIGARAENPYMAVVSLSLGDGLLNSVYAPVIGAIVDVAGPYSGVTYGFSFTMTQIGGVLAPTVTPLLAQRFGWTVALYVMPALAVLGSLAWLGIDAAKPLVVGNPVVATDKEAEAGSSGPTEA